MALALVAYSDESDISDDEICQNENKINNISDISSFNDPTYKSSNGTASQKSLPLSGIDSIIDDDFDLQIENSVNMVPPVIKPDQISNKNILSSIPAARSLNQTKTYLDLNDDEVNDVPTVSTWTITKSLKNVDTNISFLADSVKRKKTKNSKLQFILPSMAELQDEDSEEDDKDLSFATKKFQPSISGTGLFAVLPKPKNTASSLVPHSVSRINVNKAVRNKSITKTVKKPMQNIKEKIDDDSEDELETEESKDFFSLSKPSEHIEPLPTIEASANLLFNTEVHIDLPQSVEPIIDRLDNNNSLYNGTASQSNSIDIVNESESFLPFSNHPESINQEALIRLRGRRNNEIVNVIDINADDALMSRHEWRTRAASDPKPTKSFSKKKDGNPTQLQRRKHQITYLAHQAQEREQDLQNTWSQNRYTKMQTQSKYGF